MAKLKLSFEEIENEIHEDLVEVIEEPTESTEGTVDAETPEMTVESEADEEIAIEEMFNEISDEISENDKVIEVVDGLDDIKTAVGDKDELTPTEVSLIDVAANMGAAGTDIDGSQLLPATEKFSDKNFALETLSARIAVAQEGLMDSLRSIYQKSADFIKSLFSFTYKMELKIKEAKRLLSQIKSAKTKEVTVSIKKSKFLAKDSSTYVTDTQDYVSSLKSTVEFYNKWSDVAIASVVDYDKSVSTWAKTMFSRDKTNEAAEGLYNAYMKKFIGQSLSVPGMQKVTTKQGDFVDTANVDTFKSPGLLGGYAVVVSKVKTIPEFDIDKKKEMKEAVVSSKVTFFNELPLLGLKDNGEAHIKLTFNASALQEMITQSEKALVVFRKFLNKSYNSFRNYVNWFEGVKVETASPIMGFHTLMVNRGINNAVIFTAIAKSYSKALTQKPIDLAMKVMQSKKWAAEAV